MAAVPPARTGRDPAVVLRGAAGACWALFAALVLAGTSGPCHDNLRAEADGASAPGPVLAFAVWLVMTVAMMLPTVVPLARMFVVATARGPHPAAARSAVPRRLPRGVERVRRAALLGHRAVDALLVGRPVRPAARARRRAGRRRARPVQPGEARLPEGLPQPVGVPLAALRAAGSAAAGARCAPRPALPGLLLGADARDGRAPGIGSLLWMLALAAAMTVEKTAPWGARLVAPLGVALVLAGVAVARRPGRWRPVHPAMSPYS